MNGGGLGVEPYTRQDRVLPASDRDKRTAGTPVRQSLRLAVISAFSRKEMDAPHCVQM